MPTITFTDQSSGDALAIWSEAVDRFVIWFPPAMTAAEDIPDIRAVEGCIGLFFDGQMELAGLISGLDSAAESGSEA